MDIGERGGRSDIGGGCTVRPDDLAHGRRLRLLLTGRLAAAVAGALADLGYEHEVRVAADPDRPTAAELTWADALSGFAMPPAAEATDPRWAWVHGMGAGWDAFAPHLDRIGILTRTVGTMPAQMGRYVLAAALGFVLHGDAYRAAREARVWRPLDATEPGLAVVLGTGEVAAGAARALRGAGFEVVGINTTGRPAPGFERVLPWSALAQVLPATQVLVDLLPATPATTRLVGPDVFARLSGAAYVSAGRGVTTDHDALRRALEDGSVAHATLDVTDPEPPPPDSWLWTHPRVDLTPHIAARTRAVDVATALTAVSAALTGTGALDPARGAGRDDLARDIPGLVAWRGTPIR